MNRQMMVGVIIGAAAATAVVGVAGIGMMNADNYAEVIAVKPVSNFVSVPREECRNEVVTVQKPVKDEHQVIGTVAGAVIGGALGNQVGGGRGKDLATVGGAVAGGYAGNKIQEKVQEGNTEQVTQRVCSTVHDRVEEPAGFEVTYLFEGQERVVTMAEEPGSRIRIEDGSPVLEP